MKTLPDGITDVPVNNRDYFKNKKYFSLFLLKKIDTAAIYVETYSYRSFEKDFSPFNNKISHRGDGWRNVYKFYSNGCMNLFAFKDDYEIKKEDIDPERGGLRGVYYLDDKNNIKTDFFGITGYSFICTRLYGVNTRIIEVKGDTLLIKNPSDLTFVEGYVKRKIPEDWLIYKADWQ